MSRRGCCHGRWPQAQESTVVRNGTGGIGELDHSGGHLCQCVARIGGQCPRWTWQGLEWLQNGRYGSWRTPADVAYPEAATNGDTGQQVSSSPSGPLARAVGKIASKPAERDGLQDAASKAKLAVARQVIIQWDPKATASDRQEALAGVDVVKRTTLNTHTSGDAPPVQLATVEGSREAALAKLDADPAVLSAEPNRILRRAKDGTKDHTEKKTLELLKCFNDPRADRRPAVAPARKKHRARQQVRRQRRQGLEERDQGRPDVYVGIVDEGVDIRHADLATNKFVNYWDPINGIDDDHNGYIDDRYGWDFFNNNNTVFDGATGQLHRHPRHRRRQ